MTVTDLGIKDNSQIIFLKEFDSTPCQIRKGKLSIPEAIVQFTRHKCYASINTPAAVLSYFPNCTFKEVQPKDAIVIEYKYTTDDLNDNVEFYLVV